MFHLDIFVMCLCYAILQTRALRFQIDVTVGEDYYKYENTALSSIYKSLKVNGIEECFNACKADSACLFVTLRRELNADCFLCNGDDQRPSKNVNFVTISKKAFTQIIPYFYKYWSIRLINHYKSEKNVTTENDCFDLCSKQLECHAVIYNRVGKFCYFYQKDNYESKDDDEFISMSGKEKLNLKHTQLFNNYSRFVYKNVRLFGHYMYKPMSSAENCFDECKKDAEMCFAVLYGQYNMCYFYKKGEFSIGIADINWLVISKERLVEEPNLYRFVGVRLYNQYDYSSASNEQCTRQCESQSECFAVAYRPNSNMGCFLYNYDQYRTAKVDVQAKKWEIISKDAILVDDKKYETKISTDSEKNNPVNFQLRPFNYPNIRLTNHYVILENITSAESCFQNCTSISECFAVGFHKHENVCNFFKSGEFEVENNNAWTVLSRDILEMGLKSTFTD